MVVVAVVVNAVQSPKENENPAKTKRIKKMLVCARFQIFVERRGKEAEGEREAKERMAPQNRKISVDGVKVSGRNINLIFA